jgi:dihydroorotate dehydrogenase
MSPESTKEDVDVLYKSGFRQFHCSNTIPLGEKGGLSGSSLIPYTSKLVKMIKEEYEDVTVIAGGGVSNKEIADKYLKLGADHVSVSSAYFNPLNLLFLRF